MAWCWGLGKGYSQGETSHHNGVEGKGQLLNREAREIHWLEHFHNGGICGGGHKVPHRRSIGIMRLPWCGRGVHCLGLA